MNPKYDTKLKVKDMQSDDISMIQHIDEVKHLNEQYNEDYTYYFVKWCEGCADKLFGADNCFLHNNVYFVADL